MAALAVATRVGDPDVTVQIDEDAVRPSKQSLAETPDPASRRLVDVYRRIVIATDATVLSAALGKPEVAVGIRVDGAHCAHCSALGRLEPVWHLDVRIRLGKHGCMRRDRQQRDAKQPAKIHGPPVRHSITRSSPNSRSASVGHAARRLKRSVSAPVRLAQPAQADVTVFRMKRRNSGSIFTASP